MTDGRKGAVPIFWSSKHATGDNVVQMLAGLNCLCSIRLVSRKTSLLWSPLVCQGKQRLSEIGSSTTSFLQTSLVIALAYKEGDDLSRNPGPAQKRMERQKQYTHGNSKRIQPTTVLTVPVFFRPKGSLKLRTRPLCRRASAPRWTPPSNPQLPRGRHLLGRNSLTERGTWCRSR